MPRFYIELEDDELENLKRMAKKERREFAAQAAYMIAREIELWVLQRPPERMNERTPHVPDFTERVERSSLETLELPSSYLSANEVDPPLDPDARVPNFAPPVGRPYNFRGPDER